MRAASSSAKQAFERSAYGAPSAGMTRKVCTDSDLAKSLADRCFKCANQCVRIEAKLLLQNQIIALRGNCPWNKQRQADKA